MTQNWEKFKVLMWKNFTLHYRNPIDTVMEILTPLFFTILLVLLRSNTNPTTLPTKIFPEFSPLCAIPNLPFCPVELANSSSNATFFLNEEYCLVYSPKNDIFDRSFGILNLLPKFSVIGYNTSTQLENHFENKVNNYTIAGIQFDDSLLGKKQLPKHLEVNIRFPSELRIIGRGEISQDQTNWCTNSLFPENEQGGPRYPNSLYGAIPNYYSEGFLTLEMLVTYILMIGQTVENVSSLEKLKTIMTNMEIPDITMKRFPFSSWKSDPLLPLLDIAIGLYLVLGFIYACVNIIKAVAYEKENQLKEAVKIMGLSNWLHWLAWFAKSFILLFLTTVLLVIVLKISWFTGSVSVFTYANSLILLIFFSFYITASITLCFAFSTFFSKANTAATIGGLMFFLMYFPYLLFQANYNRLSLFFKLFLSLASNTALAFGLKIILRFEGSQEGVHWSNLFSPTTPDDKLSLGLIIVMLAVDSLIYMLIALYVEAVFPGEYGMPQPWFFPFTAQYWTGLRVDTDDDVFDEVSLKSAEFLEKDPTNMVTGIKIRNLRKVFGQKIAVENLTLNMYEDHITVLLGHNGAGKTTTMSMLTGMFPPTSGTAIISGYDIRTNIDEVRHSLGLCPQHNIIFDDLTVEEHLYFFSKLKGLKVSEINKEIYKFISLLELTGKADTKVSKLSGGMKRKLCVGIALCGNSKVVMLDEPTAGMDPSARRALWDLLQAQKKGRTILLTTHYMDEADLLGDRIAIMANGQLQCCGSSFFLKKKFGTGYHLIMEKTEFCNPDDVTLLLKKYIPYVEIHSNIGAELSYLLPENQIFVFENMLEDLEINSENLGVHSFGLSLTTLEEVFMKVGIESIEQDNGPGLRNEFIRNQQIQVNSENIKMLTGFQLIKNQFLAMFMKKLISTYRGWWIQLIQIILPIYFIVNYLKSEHSFVLQKLPPLELTLDSYHEPITLINNDDSVFSHFYINNIAQYETFHVNNITNTVLQLTATEPGVVIKKYIVGASFRGKIKDNIEKIIVWFNNNPYHSPPLALGLVLNSVYKQIMSPKHNIKYYNYPLPYTSDTKINAISTGTTEGTGIAFQLALCMTVVPSLYVFFYIRERTCTSKHLQIVSGVNVCVFWLSSYIWDMLLFILTIITIIITFICFQEDGFATFDQLLCIFILLFSFGIAILPMIYFTSFLFDIPSTAYSRVMLFCIISTVFPMIVMSIASSGSDPKQSGQKLRLAFLLLPNYSLYSGLVDFSTNYDLSKLCKNNVKSCIEFSVNNTEDMCWAAACLSSKLQQVKGILGYCCSREPNYYKWEAPGIGSNIYISLGFGLGLFILLLIIEYKILSNLINTFIHILFQKDPIDYVEDEDDDVAMEKERIHNTSMNQLTSENMIVLKDMTKYYKEFLAVNGLNVCIKKYECFGLLGINGAGKTTTFKMMTGDVPITYGNGWINAYSIKTQITKVHKMVGYCPQFDALLEEMTARETLYMFSLIRGIPRGDCYDLSEMLSKKFDFHRHIEKKVKQMSGGNKRKLSASITLIGDPPVIYFDEPTAGMDPATRRYFWNAICEMRDRGKCIVLTSHSMEECEALCTRLAIMVNGNFKCLGSTQHLKSKFAAGFTLTIKVKANTQEDDTDNIEQFIKNTFPTAVLKEKHQELLTFFIVDETITWSKMFGILEQSKHELNIKDYSLGQASLEQADLII